MLSYVITPEFRLRRTLSARRRPSPPWVPMGRRPGFLWVAALGSYGSPPWVPMGRRPGFLWPACNACLQCLLAMLACMACLACLQCLLALLAYNASLHCLLAVLPCSACLQCFLTLLALLHCLGSTRRYHYVLFAVFVLYWGFCIFCFLNPQ